jgi:hypothetical protein
MEPDYELRYSKDSLKLIVKIFFGWFFTVSIAAFFVYPFIEDSFIGLVAYLMCSYLLFVALVWLLSRKKKSEDIYQKALKELNG